MLSSLSDIQKQIVFRTGSFVVRACPGSGKTYSVSARLAHQLDSWPYKNQGVACLSFTNTAWQEIERSLKENFKKTTPVPYPHFLGTIDSFLNKYVFLPFGHLVMGCKRRPIIVGEPHGSWSGRNFSEGQFDKISYDINGNLYAHNPRKVPQKILSNDYVIAAKHRLNRLGFATQADANYYCMILLRKYPDIVKALLRRFPTIVVDEAQDTSDIHMTILDMLIENGLTDLVLVGDPDQAIYEWNDAKPELFIKKFNDWENPIILNENRRSSQHICNFTYKISSLDDVSPAVTQEVKNYSYQPQIISYKAPNEVIQPFLDLCGSYKIDVNSTNVAVLCRSKSIVREIMGVKKSIDEPWEKNSDVFTEELCKAKFLYDENNFKDGFKLAEKAIIKGHSKTSHCTKEHIEEMIKRYGFIKWRRFINRILISLPKTDNTVKVWCEQANKFFAANNIKLEAKHMKTKGHVKCEELFTIVKQEKAYRIDTVHGVKGETFQAALLLLKQKAGTSKYYRTLLSDGACVKNNEELRILYVGITRPRKLLMLAVPEEDEKIWLAKFFG